jgi:hypothetical protein
MPGQWRGNTGGDGGDGSYGGSRDFGGGRKSRRRRRQRRTAQRDDATTGSEGTTSSVSPIDIEQATGSSGYYSEESDTSTNAYWDPHGRFSKNTEDDTKTIVPIEGLMESEKVRDDIHADLLVKKPTVDAMKKGINDNIGKMVKNLEVIHAIKSQAGCSISADQTQVSQKSKQLTLQGKDRQAPGARHRAAQHSLGTKMSRHIPAYLGMWATSRVAITFCLMTNL